MQDNKLKDDSAGYTQLLAEIQRNILTHRYRAAKAVNQEQLRLYLLVGHLLAQKIEAAEWGAGIADRVSADLRQALPGLRGFSRRNLFNMRQLAIEYAPLLASLEPVNPTATDDPQIVQLATAQFTDVDAAFIQNVFLGIGFTHHILLLSRCKDWTERRFYMEETVRNQWTVDTLEFAISGQFYRARGQMPNTFSTYLPETLKNTAVLTFRDEYLLDFINIDPDDERVLERHIVQNIQRFLLGLGKGFTFIGSQYRQLVDGDEYYVDLLFYNRILKCLVAIDLKKGEFKPEYAGKMNFYLNALNDNERMPDENPSIGIILCKTKSNVKVEYAFKGVTTPMGVATYRLSTELPGAYRDVLPDSETLVKLLDEPESGE
ncbi:PDDEXK nuclease domain-containing protein [Nibrella viscosa]|uniref:PDDEXK nuclease domain-containing protein n=1 Tax=Nibrella viscosa TaxID=1084524 RepID=A0ABP8KYE8_9BACT